jgi:hypothetical protein
MVDPSKKTFVRRLLAGPVLVLVAWGASGCSDSSSPSNPVSDASTADVEAGPPPPLGVPVTSCAGCPVCGGILTSPDAGATYCTQACSTNADCPSGTGCVMNVLTASLDMDCLRTCTSNADCLGGFICRSDLGTPGSFCWSPYPTPVDSGTPVADAAADAGVDAAPADAGEPDGATPDGSADAATDAALDAGPDADAAH